MLGHRCTVHRCQHPRYRWRASFRSNGSLKSKYFKLKKEAEAWADEKQTENQLFGAGEQLSADARLAVLEYAPLLKEHGWTIRMALEHSLNHLERISGSATVNEWMEQFLALKRRKQITEKTMTDYESRLGRFAVQFGDRTLATIEPNEILDYINGLNQSPKSATNVRKILHAFFTSALEHKPPLVSGNPCPRASELPRIVEKDVEILTPAQAEEIMAHAPEDLIPRLALQLFAGIRTEELARLKWDAISLKRGVIRVSGDTSKTGRKRQIPIAKNLQRWLEPYDGQKGLLFGETSNRLLAEFKKGLSFKIPHNAMRHSYGSYRLEQCHDVGRVSLEMGNTPAMVMKHYHEVVFPEDATGYWQIVP